MHVSDGFSTGEGLSIGASIGKNIGTYLGSVMSSYCRIQPLELKDLQSTVYLHSLSHLTQILVMQLQPFLWWEVCPPGSASYIHIHLNWALATLLLPLVLTIISTGGSWYHHLDHMTPPPPTHTHHHHFLCDHHQLHPNFCVSSIMVSNCCLWLVSDFGGRSLDTDPGFSRYWHFCSAIIDVRTDKTLIKGLSSTKSENYAVLWIGFILKFILVEEILVPKKASKLGLL